MTSPTVSLEFIIFPPTFYTSTMVAVTLHWTYLPAAGSPPGESDEVWGRDPVTAASEREKNPLPVHRGARGQREDKEEAEKWRKGQAAEAGEEEVKGGISSPPSPIMQPSPVPTRATAALQRAASVPPRAAAAPPRAVKVPLRAATDPPRAAETCCVQPQPHCVQPNLAACSRSPVASSPSPALRGSCSPAANSPCPTASTDDETMRPAMLRAARMGPATRKARNSWREAWWS